MRLAGAALLLVAAGVHGLVVAPTRPAAPRSAASALRSPSPPSMRLPSAQDLAPIGLALLLAFSGATDAQAARSGGRVGGRAPPRAAPRAAPVQQRTTNVYVAPTVSPFPAVGYGYGGYGGYGYGGFNPGLSLGLSFAELLIREQQRQAFIESQLRQQRQLGADEAKIAELQRALAEQNAKVNAMQTSGQAPAQQAPAAVTPEQAAALQRQLAEQQAKINALEAAAAK